MASYGVIGASGFVGQHLCAELLRRGHQVRAIVRTAGSALDGCEEVAVGDFTQITDWTSALRDLDTAFLLGARAHVMKETSANPLAEFRKMNVEVAVDNARAAVEAGVRRIIFLSSIGVNGETTRVNHPFTVWDDPNPQMPYAISKLEAETELQKIHAAGKLDVVIIRSPLVYGPGAKGNFLRLLRLVSKGIPLPLASARNPRAMISIGNLCDVMINATDMPRGERMLAIVNDKGSLSTADVVRLIAVGMDKPIRLVPCPPNLMRTMMTCVGLGREATKLLDPLEVEISATWSGFDWQPPLSTEHEIVETSQRYREESAN